MDVLAKTGATPAAVAEIRCCPPAITMMQTTAYGSQATRKARIIRTTINHTSMVRTGNTKPKMSK
ncbi:hypothetical protein RvY_14867 [Ramazzottius varieornatus]|uniref:Uncharacterized protein n=1 Tax=Ramazzottius varieornatus TaxID=947166 RepID=A0A1D1VSS9_RAMVA|nr:hypothetical protein RvY_14867 [Ramazzottius varieornatus]